jgi:hypothetical protein
LIRKEHNLKCDYEELEKLVFPEFHDLSLQRLADRRWHRHSAIIQLGIAPLNLSVGIGKLPKP